MSSTKGDSVSKRVQFTTKDDDQQVATGIVMVPDVVDLQGDFVRDDTIRGFAEQFATFVEAGEAEGGVMHAVWPSEHIFLEENLVLDSATEIGGETAPAGAWVQSWQFEDAELWSLVSDGILEGYSIGAVDVEWSDPISQDDLPEDVDVTADYPESEPVWELRAGLIREVSAVDIPAVPDAMILETKSEAMKRLADHLGNRQGFIEEAVERGHAEDEAERLWAYLDRAVDVDGAGTSGAKRRLSAAGKAFLNVLTGTEGTDAGEEPPEQPDRSKESRTLSADNRIRLMAAHDALEDALASDVDFITNRFTDNPGVDFDIADYSSKVAPTDEPPDEQPEPEHPDDNAPATTTDETTTDMSDDDPLAEPPEWAEAMHDDIEANSTQLADLAEKVEAQATPDDPKTAWEEAPEWAKQLREEQHALQADLERLADKAGKSQQLASDPKTDAAEPSRPTKADVLGLPGGDD